MTTLKKSSAAVGNEPDTRTHILDTAWSLIAERGDAAVTLIDVAQRAGLSRQTLYLQFRSRAGLLLAMVDQVDSRSSIPARLGMLRQTLAPADALAPYLRAWFEYVPVVFPVARALAAAAAAGDADAAAAWDSRMQKVRGGLLSITAGLHKSGALRPPWTPATAADWAFNLSHVDTWQHLVVEAAWKPRDLVDRVVDTLCAELIAAPARTAKRTQSRP